MEKFFLRSIMVGFDPRDHPIEVSATQFSSLFFATCPSVSGVVAGQGKTVLEALFNLTTIVNVINANASELTAIGPAVERYVLMVTKELKP